MNRSIFSTILRSIVITIIIFAGNFSIYGQTAGSTTSNITGTITDDQKALISGVTVTAKNLQTGFTRETQSGEDGSFNISQLTPGTYELMAKAPGFVTKTSHLELVLGTTALFDITLQVGETSEVIEVTANTGLDAGKTESSTSIDRQRIDNLPINTRDFLDFSKTAPRVATDRTPKQGVTATSGLSFNGQPARFNNITIDGLDNNDIGSGSVRSTFSQEAVAEFQVVSDSYSAEFGRALGGIVNIVTKGGGNQFHGNLFLFNRNDSISARNAFSPINPEFKQYQFGATLSGPIKKEKAFFFLSFERLSLKQNNIVTIADQSIASAQKLGFAVNNGPSPFSVGDTTILGRADIQLNANDTLWLRYNSGFEYNGALEPFGGLTAETNGGIQRLADYLIAADNTYINPVLNLINETRLLYSRRDQDITPIDAGPLVSLVAPEGTITFGRSSLLPQARLENIYQLVDNVSLIRGKHQFKFGGDFSYTRLANLQLPFFPGGEAIFTPLDFSMLLNRPGLPFFTGLQAFDPSLRTPAQRGFLMILSSVLPTMFATFPKGVPLADLALPRTYLQGFGNPNQGNDEKNFSLFFQDNIKLRPNLMINLGLRYDLNRVGLSPTNSGDLSPRLSISYRPLRISNLNLRASYGLFFGTPLIGTPLAAKLLSSGQIKIPVVPLPFSVLPFAQPSHHFPDANEIPPGVPFIPQLSQIDATQPDLKDSYTQQISTGFDYLIGKTIISLTYDYVRGIRLYAVRNINPVVRPVPGDLLASLETGRVDPTQGNVFEFESGFDSYYHAFTISVNRRLSNRINFLSHYTFSKAIDDFLDFRTAIQETVDPLNPRNERGLSLQDVRNRFVLSGTWDLSYTKNRYLTGFLFSTILNLESGRPYNLLAGVDLNMNGDNPPGDRPAGLGRNVGITPGFSNMDLRLTKTIKFGESKNLQIIAEVFNLFNQVNISDFDRTFPPDANGQFQLPAKEGSRFVVSPDRYRGAFAPREFQFGFRFAF